MSGQARSTANGRPHVLALVDRLSGGAESFARLIAINLDRDRYRRTLCVTREPEDDTDERLVRQELEAAGVELLMLRRRGRGDLGPWLRLVRYLRDERVDVLHAHKFGSNVWASLLRGPAGTPIVLAHEHTWSYEGQPLRRMLDRRLIARRCDRFIAVSPIDRKRMIEIERIDSRKIIVVPVGIPPRSPSGHDVRAELGISPDAPVVVSVGHLRPQKAYEVLIEASSRLRETLPALRTLIVGDGTEQARLRSMIASLGLDQQVSLLGLRRDVMDVVAAADVTVCCSDFEGSPQAVIEYMAAAKPVVATRVGGLPDLVEQGVTGLLVEPRAPTALADAIAALLSDPTGAAELGAAGRARQRAELTIDVTISRIDALYRELLHERGLRSPPGPRT